MTGQPAGRAADDSATPAPGKATALPTAAPTGRLIPFQSEDQWHALRAQDVTASALGGYFGLSKWSSEYSEYVEKAGLAQAPRKQTPWMLAGNYLEDGIARMAAAQEGWTICSAGEYADSYDLLVPGEVKRPVLPSLGAYLRDPDARLGATPDRIILTGLPGGERPLEVKNVSWQAFKADWENGEAPVKYWLQANVQCGLGRLAGLEWDGFVIAALVAGNDLRLLSYDFDAEAFTVAQETARRFWLDVAAGREPPADCTDGATQDAIRRRYLRALPETIDLTGEPRALTVAQALAEARARASAAEKEAKALQAELLLMIGHHEAATLADGWTVTAKTQHREGYVVQGTTFRTLSAKPPKAAKAAKASPTISQEAAA